MTKSGGKRHLKRPNMPKTWPINRKGSKFIVKNNPGPHSTHQGIPLMLLLRDVLKLGDSRKEIQYMLNKGEIEVDGRIRKQVKFPVGHMDIVHIKSLEKYYRIQYHKSGKLLPFEVSKEEGEVKLVKIIGKRNIRGGFTQVSTHDGRNIRLENGDARLDDIKVTGTMKIKIPSQEILEIYHLDEDSFAMVTEGRHQGKVGQIVEITKRYGPKASEVTFNELDNKENPEFRTALEYVFVVGEDKPAIELQ